MTALPDDLQQLTELQQLTTLARLVNEVIRYRVRSALGELDVGEEPKDPAVRRFNDFLRHVAAQDREASAKGGVQ